eukprot:7060090-Pyramimonas_sp.AAC.1
MSIGEASNVGINVEHYLASTMADEAAGFRAEKCAVPNAAVVAVEHAEAIGRTARQHLAKACLAAAEAEPTRLRPARSMAVCVRRKATMSEHQVYAGMGAAFHCSACGCSATGRKPEKFLETPCLGGVAKGSLQRVGGFG